MSRTTIIAIIGTVVLAGSVIGYRYFHSADGSPYQLATVQKGELIQKVSATGIINAITTVQVGSRISGIIKEIYVDYNSRVNKGQLLALIDPDAYSAQLAQAEATLFAAKANLERANVQYREAELNVNRLRGLYEKGFVSRSELDGAEASYGTTAAQKKVQEAQVAQWEEAVNLAKVNLDYTKVKSPMKGTILSRNIEVGQVIETGPQSPALFVIAKDLAKMELKSRVSEADIGSVRKGQEVTFTVDAYSDKVFCSKVKEIRMAPDVGQNVVTYGVISHVDNEELLLRPGMTADVRIKTAQKDNILLLPAIAVREKSGKKYVEVLKKKKAVQREVMTGLGGGGGVVEILSGLGEGEEVIISYKKK